MKNIQLRKKLIFTLIFVFLFSSALFPLTGTASVINPFLSSLQATVTYCTTAPITLTTTNNNGEITLVWNAITDPKGVNGYYVFRATTSGGYSSLPETDFWTKGTTYKDTKATPGVTYFYVVRPVLADNSLGTASNEIAVNYASPFTSLKATANTGNITLEWKPVTDFPVVGYYVYKATTSKGQTSIPETDFWIRGTSYVDTKVVPGTTYYYIVRPVYENRTLGLPSNEVSVTCQKMYGTIIMTIGNAVMLVNGKLMEIDPGKGTAPVLKDARTMLPIRATIEAMGGTVDFSSSEQKVIIKWNGKTIYLWIGKTTIWVDGANKTIDVAPYYSETNRTLVPMRFVIENLGCDIAWDGNTMTATITYPLNGTVPTPPTPPTPPDSTTPTAWSGTWYTDLGKLTITQSGIYVIGNFGERRTIEGVISGNILYGVYNDRGDIGGFEFKLSSDGKKFDGSYGHQEKNKTQWCEWDGKREVDPLAKYLRQLSSPADFSGIWDSDIGRIHIDQNGSQVVMTYRDNGIIRGTVTNNKFSGFYQQGRNSGLIEMFLLEGNKTIIGHYGSEQSPRQDWREFDGRKQD